MRTASRTASRPRPRLALDETPASEERASKPGDLRSVIRAAMERAPVKRELTRAQRADADRALEDLRAGKARLVREADFEAALEELGRTPDE